MAAARGSLGPFTDLYFHNARTLCFSTLIFVPQQVNHGWNRVQCSAITNASSEPASGLGRRFPHSSGSSSYRVIYHPNQPDHVINLDEILTSLSRTGSAEEVDDVMDKWRGKPSYRLMVTLLDQETDWQRALALHDWMIEKGGYKPALYSYNIILRNVLRARKWTLGEGLVREMEENGVSPDKVTYSTLISAFGKAGRFDSGLVWLQRMEERGILPDLITYSTH
ncbi:unnamed protein product [Calypogeia fissa]